MFPLSASEYVTLFCLIKTFRAIVLSRFRSDSALAHYVPSDAFQGNLAEFCWVLHSVRLAVDLQLFLTTVYSSHFTLEIIVPQETIQRVLLCNPYVHRLLSLVAGLPHTRLLIGIEQILLLRHLSRIMHPEGKGR